VLRPFPRIALHSFGATLIVAALTSCGEGGSTSVPTTPQLSAIVVTLSASSLRPTQTTTATAAGRDFQGRAFPLGTISWSSSNTAVATVNSSGVVTAVSVGTGPNGQSQITATYNGVSGSTTLTVTP
jgi:uncharacterized protein YjdB